MGIEVEISDTQAHLRVDRSTLVRLVERVLRAENCTRASISIALVDDATIRGLNRAHLGHDWSTDVISFPLSDPLEPVLAGELVVSAETAIAAAAERGLESGHELRRYVIHGLLHLCGYDDRDQAHALIMHQRQEELLAAPSGEGYFHDWG